MRDNNNNSEIVKQTNEKHSIALHLDQQQQLQSHGLDSNLKLQVLALKEKLHQLPPQTTQDLPSRDINLLLSASQLEEVCLLLDFPKLEDEIILLLCNVIISSDISFHRCILFVKYCLLQKVLEKCSFCLFVCLLIFFFFQILQLQQPASRILFTGVLNCAKKHPKPIVHGLLLPLALLDPLLGSNLMSLFSLFLSLFFCFVGKKWFLFVGSAQCEVVNRVTKECFTPRIFQLF